MYVLGAACSQLIHQSQIQLLVLSVVCFQKDLAFKKWQKHKFTIMKIPEMKKHFSQDVQSLQWNDNIALGKVWLSQFILHLQGILWFFFIRGKSGEKSPVYDGAFWPHSVVYL